jgi:hypothetical protein
MFELGGKSSHTPALVAFEELFIYGMLPVKSLASNLFSDEDTN